MSNLEIQEVPLSSSVFREEAERFLLSNALRLEKLDLLLAVTGEKGEMLACGGLASDVLKCIAVSPQARSEGVSACLVSRLISEASARGFKHQKVFTKPENEGIFVSFGFHTIARAPLAILMENGNALEEYCAYLREHRAEGVIIMNANPFTVGHRYLVQRAASEVSRLAVIAVREDLSLFPYAERLQMLRAGCEDIADVLEGSAYQISAATFPSYFLKDLNDAAQTQMRLDIDLFGTHIAPSLGASVRFVGSESSDPLTARYNALMKELLPSYGVKVVVIPRLKAPNGRFVKASRVRDLLSQGRFGAACALTPPSSFPYLKACLAERALQMELDAPLKPGLVGPDSNGSHSDMDYALLRKSIAAIRPFFPGMATAASAEELRALGLEAEKAMMRSTGGVNTHRGAIFALGIALKASSTLPSGKQPVEKKLLMHYACKKIAAGLSHKAQQDAPLHTGAPSHGVEAVSRYGVRGARQMAEDGYKELFSFWLPYYSSIRKQPYALQRMLVFLIAALDDTCIIHRAGFERSQQLRDEAAELFGRIAHETDYTKTRHILENLCKRYASEGISPGGCADMLALTIFIDSLLTNN